MFYHFSFRSYHRPFKHPLSTSHGKWNIREGIIICLRDETGKEGWGEIAPIPWFGSETLEQALELCQELSPKITAKDIFAIPEKLSACQFGFESAWEWINGKLVPIQDIKPQLPLSYLLPTGEAVLHSWQTPWNQGSRTFKWKIGVTQIEEELKIFNQLIQSLPPSAKLRLDANGGLTPHTASQWFKVVEQVGIIEFVEQPLPPEEFNKILQMSTQYSTPIALDESVATLNQMEDCYQLGWRGIFVIKAAIAGSPQRLRRFCQEHEIDAVFSSVFESVIAKKSVLQLACELSNPNRAIGFGVNQWFNEPDHAWFEQLWKNPYPISNNVPMNLG